MEYETLDKLYSSINGDDGMNGSSITSLLDKLEVAMEYEAMLTEWHQVGKVEFQYTSRGDWKVTVRYAKDGVTKTVVIEP